MVTKNNDSRYYGRNGPRNVRLQAGEVERLFQQREQLRDDRQSLLDELSEHATIKPEEEREGIGYMRIALQAPFGCDGLLEPILSPDDTHGTRETLNELVDRTEKNFSFAWDDLNQDSFTGMPKWEKEISGYTAHLRRSGERNGERVHEQRFDAWLGFDGGMYFTVGGIAKEGPNGKIFLEGQAVKVAVKLLHLAGLVFDSVEYRGPVDIAMRISGLQGALSAHIADAAFRENIVENDEETSDTRAHVTKLVDDPTEVARSLLGRLVDVSSMGHADEIFEQDTQENVSG